MARLPKSYRWRKTTDIHREYALFELLEGETPILDIGISDAGNLEIAFNPGCSGRVVDWTQFLTLLEEGRTLAERDR